MSVYVYEYVYIDISLYGCIYTYLCMLYAICCMLYAKCCSPSSGLAMLEIPNRNIKSQLYVTINRVFWIYAVLWGMLYDICYAGCCIWYLVYDACSMLYAMFYMIYAIWRVTIECLTLTIDIWTTKNKQPNHLQHGKWELKTGSW